MVFFILPESEEHKRNVAELISAFAPVESMGQADGILEALETIRSRHPKAAICYSSAVAGRRELLRKYFSSDEDHLIILPEERGLKDSSVYIGLDCSSVDPIRLDWIIHSILEVVGRYHSRAFD